MPDFCKLHIAWYGSILNPCAICISVNICVFFLSLIIKHCTVQYDKLHCDFHFVFFTVCIVTLSLDQYHKNLQFVYFLRCNSALVGKRDSDKLVRYAIFSGEKTLWSRIQFVNQL